MKKLIFLLVLCSLVYGGMKLYRSFTRGGALADAAVAEFHARLDAAKDDEIYDTAAAAMRSATKRDDFHKFLDQLRTDLGGFKSGTRESINISSNNGNTTISAGHASTFEKGRAEEAFLFDYNADKPVLMRYDIRKNTGGTNAP